MILRPTPRDPRTARPRKPGWYDPGAGMDQPDEIAGRIVLVVDAALSAAARETCAETAAALAQRTGVPVTLATVPIETLDQAQPLLRRSPARIRELSPPALDADAMASAPFLWREGRPDWGAMWTTFCELALHGGPPQRGHAGGGGRVDLDFFLKEKTPEHFATDAAREAIAMLDAVEAPAGEMTVVLGPGWPGILLHEAVGHGLEADFNRKGVSAFSGRIGQKVASELCTVIDDGTIGSRRGSLNVDDEGHATKRNVLIENGVLRGYLQDKLSSTLLNSESTGSGRRESYAHIPMPRMTNTFMLAGESEPADIILSVPKGLYCANFGGGQVDITSGNFVFSASESYLIEDGKLTRPVRNATLIGNGPEALKYVSMVGNDLRLDEGIGTCGKEGQSVPVGVGIPTIKIDRMTVGGTA